MSIHWRCWFGHRDMVPFLTEQHTLAVRCSECQRITEGIAVAKSVLVFTSRQNLHTARQTKGDAA